MDFDTRYELVFNSFCQLCGPGSCTVENVSIHQGSYRGVSSVSMVLARDKNP